MGESMSEQEGNTFEEFKKELEELLHKYDAFLGVYVYTLALYPRLVKPSHRSRLHKE